MRHLRVECEEAAPFLLRLDAGLLRIGRDPASEVVLPGTAVSRRQAELLVRDAVMELRDVGSSNGTLLRERRREARPGDEREGWVNLWGRPGHHASAIVSVGDIVRVAGYELSFVDVDPDPDPVATPLGHRDLSASGNVTLLRHPDSGVHVLSVKAVRAALRQRRLEAGLPVEADPDEPR